MKGLSNKRVYITGAASGIGRATAQKFYDEGSEIILIDRPSLKETELDVVFPQRMVYIQGDVTTKETLEKIDAEMKKGIDLAVHSLKDLPTVLPEGLVLAAVSERETPIS